MRHHPTDDELLRNYLRGDLPEPEADALERRLLAEDDLFDLLEAVEADLLAAADRGELPAAERAWVLRRLAASAEGRERLALARALNVLADGLSPAQRPLAPVVPISRRLLRPGALRIGLAAAAALLVAAGLSWLALQQGAQPREASPLNARRPDAVRSIQLPPPGKSAAPGAQPPAAEEPGTTLAQGPRNKMNEPGHGPRERPQPVKAAFTLSLATLRGAEAVEVFHVPAGAGVVELQLDLEGLEDLAPFGVAVRDEAKNTVWKGAGLRPRRLDWGTALVLDVPAERLPAGRYEVAVAAGTEEITKEFEMARKDR